MWQACGVRIHTLNAVPSSMTLDPNMYLHIPIKRLCSRDQEEAFAVINIK